MALNGYGHIGMIACSKDDLYRWGGGYAAPMVVLAGLLFSTFFHVLFSHTLHRLICPSRLAICRVDAWFHHALECFARLKR